jgi:signal transduction histidine kinase
VHDALAHSLSALAVQLPGARLLMLRDGAPPDTVAQIERAPRLASDGMAEARRAVSALRTDAVSLSNGLRALVDELPGARLEIVGAVDELEPSDRDAVLRVAREALSNARRHAPGAPVTMRLCRAADRPEGGTELTVSDHPGRPAAPAGTGGYGLIGTAERAALIGARWDAGPTEDGWRVQLPIPR